jgi:hypothetical protein
LTDSNFQPITLQQAQIAAAAWHEIRPEWEVKSMMTRLEAHASSGDSRASFGELLRAGINAAMNPKAKTPAVIFQPGKHWLTAEQAADPVYTSRFGNDTSEDCPNHPTVKAWDCRPCRRSDPAPANLRDRIAAEAQKVRDARAAKLTPPTTTKETPNGTQPGSPAQEPQPAQQSGPHA